MNCPECDSNRSIKNGSRKNGKQNYRCLSCGRQFVDNPSPHYHISEETKTLIDRLLYHFYLVLSFSIEAHCREHIFGIIDGSVKNLFHASQHASTISL